MNNTLQEAITRIIVELIETNAVLGELERAFPMLDSSYYYNRKTKLSRRVEELEAILEHSSIKWTKAAPLEQYLVTRS